MKSAALQNLVRKIFSSEKNKAQFVSDPDTFLSAFKLTGTEKKAVLAAHARLGLESGNTTHLTTLQYWF